MAQNITLLGASYPDVPAVTLPKTGGGTARFDDCSVVTAAAADVASGKIFVASDGTVTTGTASAGGGLDYLGSLYSATIKLSDTDYATWTPSTSATAILATAEVGTFAATNVNLNDYFSRFLIDINIAYTNATAAKGRYLRTIIDNWYCITKRPSNLTNMQSSTRNGVVCEAVSNVWITYYYSSATATTLTYSQSYGFYSANVAPTSSSSTSNSPTITAKRPTINARCSSTYFATGQASVVDKANSTIKFKHEYYRALSPYNRQKSYNSMIDIWHNGL